METNKHEKIYKISECCVFRKTKEEFGGLSNMAANFQLNINGHLILTSEALYQACRYPHLPDVQKKIIAEKSPMSAKMVGKPFRSQSRLDFEKNKVKIMRWCLRVKLAQNFIEFGKLLETTLNKPIVEYSNKDRYWGAVNDKYDPSVLVGVNALGRLLMELRQKYNEGRYTYDTFVIEPLEIDNFTLFGKNIETIDERENFITAIKNSTRLTELEKPNTSEVQQSKLEEKSIEKDSDSENGLKSQYQGKQTTLPFNDG